MVGSHAVFPQFELGRCLCEMADVVEGFLVGRGWRFESACLRCVWAEFVWVKCLPREPLPLLLFGDSASSYSRL